MTNNYKLALANKFTNQYYEIRGTSLSDPLNNILAPMLMLQGRMASYLNMTGTEYVATMYEQIDVTVYLMKGTHYITICPDSFTEEFVDFDPRN